MEQFPAADDDEELITVGEAIWDVIKVGVVGPLTLAVEFENGVAGTVRFAPSSLRGTFSKLADPAYFACAGIAHGTVSWPDEEPDLAPDAMYEAFVSDGEWILS